MKFVYIMMILDKTKELTNDIPPMSVRQQKLLLVAS